MICHLKVNNLAICCNLIQFYEQYLSSDQGSRDHRASLKSCPGKDNDGGIFSSLIATKVNFMAVQCSFQDSVRTYMEKYLKVPEPES